MNLEPLDIIQNQFQNDQLAHAILCHGVMPPRELAESVVKFILNLDDLNHFDPDCMIISSDETIKVDQIREAQQFLLETPYGHDKRVLLIHEVDRTTTQAANAFLKILEEPPAKRYIVMTTSHLSKLPRTLLSRTVRFHQAVQAEAESDVAMHSKLKLLSDLNAADMANLVAETEKKGSADYLNFLSTIVVDLIKLKSGVVKSFSESDYLKALQARATGLDLNQLFSFYDSLMSQKRSGIYRPERFLLDWLGNDLEKYGRRRTT